MKSELMTDWTGPINEDYFAERARRLADATGGEQPGDPPPDRRAGSSKRETGGPKASQATKLVDLAERAPLFHDPDGNAYATVSVAGHGETWRLRSSGFRSWLARQYWEHERAIPRAGALQDALTTLEGMARFDGPEEVVHLRHARLGDVLYVDLGDPAWRAIEVDETGWRIVNDPPVRFRRTRGMLALPEPRTTPAEGIEWLRCSLNIDEDDAWYLIAAFLVGCYSGGPYPVLVLNGEQGSAKSTTSRVLRSLIDPAKTPDRAAPRDERDLIIAANNGHLIAFDNLSALRDWQSDALARLSTGAGFGTRELYTDSEESLFWAAKPIIINGITDVAVRSDLLDRALLVTLPRIPDERRKTERDYWARFRSAAPGILAAVLDGVSGALARHRAVDLDRLPRMADFATWVTAAEPALGWPDRAFVRAYTRNRRSAHSLALDAASIVPPLMALVETSREWTGSAARLFDELAGLAGERVLRREDWPSSPRALSGQLRRLAPDLRSIGIDVEFGRRSGRMRPLIVRRTEEADDRPSSPSLA